MSEATEALLINWDRGYVVM